MRLDELTIGKVGTGGVSTIDKTAPWIKHNMDVAGKRTMAVNAAKSVKDKFDIIYNIAKESKTTLINLGSFGKNSIQSYDPATGDLILKSSTSGKVKLYSTNINSYEYVGREKSIGASTKKYIFNEINPPKEISSEPNPKLKNRVYVPKKKNNNDVFSAWGE